MVSDIISLEMAWILPLIVIFGLLFLKIILPNLTSGSEKGEEKKKREEKKKAANWKKSALLGIISQGVLIAFFILLTLFLTPDPHKYMGFPISIQGVIVNFGIGGLLGISIWIPYCNIPRIWRSEKERLKKMYEAIPGPNEAKIYWVPITILLGAYLEEICFRGALIAVPAALLTFPYDLWIIFILASSFFAAMHVVQQGSFKWDRKIDLVRGVSTSFAFGLLFIWRWSIVAAGAFHFMTNLIPGITYHVRE